jgi:hypothetical protein
MGRNKIVYGLASAAIVVSVKHRTGGTWAGADEALRGHWLPVFVRRSQDAGSAGLVGLGARELPWEMPPPSVSVEDLTSQALSNIETPVQDTLFDMEPASPKSRRSRKSRPH